VTGRRDGLAEQQETRQTQDRQTTSQRAVHCVRW
jgi:hypothetical protein